MSGSCVPSPRSSVSQAVPVPQRTETCESVRSRFWLGITAGVVIGILIASVGLGRAHRLSGHPHSLAGKLALAKAQVKHDRASGDPWLARDRAYVRKLRLKMASPVTVICIVFGPYCRRHRCVAV